MKALLIFLSLFHVGTLCFAEEVKIIDCGEGRENVNGKCLTENEMDVLARRKLNPCPTHQKRKVIPNPSKVESVCVPDPSKQKIVFKKKPIACGEGRENVNGKCLTENEMDVLARRKLNPCPTHQKRKVIPNPDKVESVCVPDPKSEQEIVIKKEPIDCGAARENVNGKCLTFYEMELLAKRKLNPCPYKQKRKVIPNPDKVESVCVPDEPKSEQNNETQIAGCEGGTLSDDGTTISCPNGNVYKLVSSVNQTFRAINSKADLPSQKSKERKTSGARAE